MMISIYLKDINQASVPVRVLEGKQTFLQAKREGS